jgi:hypothetical protein
MPQTMLIPSMEPLQSLEQLRHNTSAARVGRQQDLRRVLIQSRCRTTTLEHGYDAGLQ